MTDKELKNKKLPKRKKIVRRVERSLQKRHARETRFKMYGIIAIGISFLFLFALMFNIISNGYSAFFQTKIKIPVTFDQELILSLIHI